MKKQYLEVGQIVSTHGIKGEVRLNPWCDSPEFLNNFKTLYFDAEGKNAVKVVLSRPHKNVVILKLDGVDSVEQASALRDKILYMDRNDAGLSDNTYFIQDLIGCKVIDCDSEVEYGEICEVSETGANDVWHIKAENGKVYLIPAVPEFIASTDVDGGIVKIKPIKGFFGDEQEIRDED